MNETTTERHALCKYLRTKNMFCAADMTEFEAMLEVNPYQGFWCEHTMTETGPDDAYVEYLSCTPGRACYAPLGE